MQFGQDTDVVHHLRRLAPATLIKIAGIAAVMSRAANVTVARVAVNCFRLVAHLHQVLDKGLHLWRHRRRYRDVDACGSSHRHEAAARITVSIERTSFWQHRACNALMTPYCAPLDHFWRCEQISWTDSVTAKLSHGTYRRLRVRPCIGGSGEHATEHERGSASVLSFHLTCLFVVRACEAPKPKLADHLTLRIRISQRMDGGR